jgi:hypothetical protein
MIPDTLFSQYVTGLSMSLSPSRRQQRTKIYVTVISEGYDEEDGSFEVLTSHRENCVQLNVTTSTQTTFQVTKQNV